MEMDHRDVEPGAEQAPIEMELSTEDTAGQSNVCGRLVEEKSLERENAEGKQKVCFGFSCGGGGGRGCSSSSSSSTSSESEAEQQDRRSQMDQWNLKRPGGVELHNSAGKRQKNI